ncbi:DUF4190 domain-containing protein [Amycolatopsis sp. H20-H5]|uniref:DUF4190 domain-containing protein n=1 Tax=Amycolatopsis sp. H20-H5 TaxID=3046309 RepID=UPI002DB903A1|nr:DUF4190 domain-containing protein [Amycolatopsis sp. H20-H5]MEC3982275.1 DUF4190 domain-containing protein [Amycolatopsis sp. H20-H5]
MPTEPHFPLPPAARHGRTAMSSRPPQPKNGLGTAGFIVGLVGLVVAVLPLLGIVGSPLVIIGLVLSLLGLKKVRKGLANNKGMAITGIVLSMIGILVCAGWLVFTFFIADKLGGGALHLPALPGDKHQVEFMVTSSGGATVRYGSFSDQRTETAPASTDAWRAEASYNSGSYVLSLTADSRNTGTISCSILVDGKSVADNSGSTIALCTANLG